MIESFEQYNKQRKGLKPEFYSTDQKKLALTESVMGLTTEANEIVYNIQKAMFRDTEIDVPNIKEELGDVMWYVGEIINQLDLDFNEILNLNVEKLQKRYSNGFNPHESVARDTTEERKIFEKN
jgi:NTP pyrophosphatase (non-canonical NTP hydrolase)